MKQILNPKFLIRLGITIGVSLLLYFQLKKAGELPLIAQKVTLLTESPVILLAAFIFLLSLFFSTLQWKMLLDIQHIRIPFYLLWKFYMIGLFFSNFLPTNWGGDIVRIYDTGIYSQDWEKSTASIIMDRIMGLFALFVLGLIHAFLFYSDYFRLQYLLIVLVGMILFILLFIFLDFKKMEGFIKGKNRIIRKIGHFMDKFLSALAKYQKDPRLLPVFGIALITQYLRVLMNIFVAIALGFGLSQIPFVNYFVVIPVVGLISALPISISGIGVREVMGSFMVNNMLPGQDNTVTIMFTLGFLVMTFISLCGAFYFLQLQAIKKARKDQSDVS